MHKKFLRCANLTLGYLELRFINQHKDADIAANERALWASELERGIEAERITPDNIKLACDLWADINQNGYPPTIDQFIGCLRKVSHVPRVALPNKEIPFKDVFRAFTEDEKLDSATGWLRICPRPMPNVMLEWVKEQSEDIKTRLRNSKKNSPYLKKNVIKQLVKQSA